VVRRLLEAHSAHRASALERVAESSSVLLIGCRVLCGHRINGVAARLIQIATNARDDSALGRFRAEALGWSVSSEEPGVTSLEPVGFTGR
jgi:hypothetical protein